ncbi:MAG: adenylosuccinate synthase [Nitrospinota bacterium]
MPVKVIVGAQWGDEGKGKIVDMLSHDADYVARYQGGANAGHTIVVGGQEHILHLIPSGVLRSGVISIIGTGVVIDPGEFINEVNSLKSKGIDPSSRLFISNRAHIIAPYHMIMDKLAESNPENTKVGTTGRGIGPAYQDKFARIGIRAGDIVDSDKIKEDILRSIRGKNIILQHLFKKSTIEAESTIKWVVDKLNSLKEYLADTDEILREAIRNGKNVIAEGAQGSMLDIDHGTYPYVTSSSTASGGACTGLGIPPTAIKSIVGVMKAYTTRVGLGPLPTELTDKHGMALQSVGAEIGATTSRVRRCGWFDAVVGKYSVELNGITDIALTKLDVLDSFEEIQICVDYELDGKRLGRIPNSISELARVKPVYEASPGWCKDISEISTFNALPDNAKKYVEKIERLTGSKVSIISTGKERESTILL